MSDIIRAASYSEIESTRQINSRNLNQAIKFTTVLSSPLISFFVGKSLGFDDFGSILHQKFEGELLNAIEKADFKALEKYKFINKAVASLGDYVKSATDSAPSFYVSASTALTASATDSVMNVSANGSYLLQEGVRLFNPRTRECIVVLETAEGNTNIPVQRGANGSTVGTIATTDTLIVTGVALDLYTPQTTSSRPVPRRGSTIYNGFRRLFTPGTPVTNTIKEEALLYNGQFLDLLDEEHGRAHKSMLINSLIYEEFGDISAADKTDPLSNINKFNGYRYWARQNPVTAGFSDIGAMTSAKFESLMTWFETYDNLGTRNAPMVYICGKTAYKALQPFLKQGILVTVDDGYTPATVGGRVQRYITEAGRMVYIAVDDYLSLIGRGGDIIMCAEDNMTLYVGEDNFLTPENVAITSNGMLPGEARFLQFIENYSVRNNQRINMMVSQYSMLPAYVELCAMATGITAS
jgi:hypothetical protein